MLTLLLFLAAKKYYRRHLKKLNLFRMKKGIIGVYGMMIMAFLFSSCNKINGEGPVVTETRDISGFTGIDMAISGVVQLTPDSIYSLEIQAQKNILDVIETSVINGTLQIGLKRNTSIRSFRQIRVLIHTPAVSTLSVSGSADIYTDKPLHSDNLQLSISGSGSVSISQLQCSSLQSAISGSGSIAVGKGIADNEEIHISGSGKVDLSEVAAQHVTVHSSGSGNVKVNAVQTIDAHISGSGNIYYQGNPRITIHVSGSGKLIAL
jgi:hypothetical protein